MSPSPACIDGTCGGTCGRKNVSISKMHHCDSPGCTGGRSIYDIVSNTQNNKRPKVNPHSVANTDDENYSEIVWTVETSSKVLAIIVYPAVEKFNGLKLAVYNVDTWKKLKNKLNKLDPHFYDDAESPLARFTPTRVGLNMAYDMIGVSDVLAKQSSAIIDQLLAYRNKALK